MKYDGHILKLKRLFLNGMILLAIKIFFVVELMERSQQSFKMQRLWFLQNLQRLIFITRGIL